MSELDFIDSSGVAMLFGLVRRLSSRRQELRVVAPKGKPVARVLEIVEFERAAPVCLDVDAPRWRRSTRWPRAREPSR